MHAGSVLWYEYCRYFQQIELGHRQSVVSARLLCSMSGLETLDGNLFITIASGDYFEALIEGLAELVHIVQLDCELHQFNLGLLCRLGLHTADDPDLDWNGLAELTTLRAAESE